MNKSSPNFSLDTSVEKHSHIVAILILCGILVLGIIGFFIYDYVAGPPGDAPVLTNPTETEYEKMQRVIGTPSTKEVSQEEREETVQLLSERGDTKITESEMRESRKQLGEI